MKPDGESPPIKHTDKTCVSSINAFSCDRMSKKPNGKTILRSDSSAKTDEVLFFKDVEFGPQEGELRFRLIHFLEARNPLTKMLIGLEMLLIDEQVYSEISGTVIQGFIPPGRINTYLPHMVSGAIYRLTKFYGSKSKIVFRVAEPSVTITFSWNSVLSVLEDSSVRFPEDRFRFYGYKEFEAACDHKGDLYDYVGHMRLVNDQTQNDSLVLDEAEIASTRRILLHVQSHDEPLIKLYLWDKAATDFCEKFKAHAKSPSVILVTTLNPKRFGGALSLSSLSSSRVFFDNDVQPTRDYLTWLGANLEVANRVNADIVTKTETATLGEIFSYMKQEGAKVAWFECTATIDDVVHGSAWYYIACGGCRTKATKGHTTLMCKKCGKADVTGVAEYLMKISVYDNNDQAKFVLLADAGFDLIGKKASELVESYFEANESVEADHVVPVPQALIDTIGQTHKFVVKVSDWNLTGRAQSLTVTKVLRPEAPELGRQLVSEDSADERVKRSYDIAESEDAKRARRG